MTFERLARVLAELVRYYHRTEGCPPNIRALWQELEASVRLAHETPIVGVSAPASEVSVLREREAVFRRDLEVIIEAAARARRHNFRPDTEGGADDLAALWLEVDAASVAVERLS